VRWAAGACRGLPPVRGSEGKRLRSSRTRNAVLRPALSLSLSALWRVCSPRGRCRRQGALSGSYLFSLDRGWIDRKLVIVILFSRE
jgi:hypothetical protein